MGGGWRGWGLFDETLISTLSAGAVLKFVADYRK